jgi:hypothetical protein
MRKVLIGIAFLLCVGVAAAQEPPPTQSAPFVVNRGSAPPPQAAAAQAGQTAPAEGETASGFVFGAWRSADPEVYGPAFEAQMRRRYAAMSVTAARADLEANGFACADGPRALQCRIEIMDRGCEKGWYVVFEARGPEPIAGFDAICPRG